MTTYDLSKDLAPSFWHGSIAIGTSESQVTATAVPVLKGIQLKADAANTGIIYVGKSGVTDASADGTDGFPLSAGDGLFLPLDDVSLVYAIASAAAQELYWLVI